MFKFFLMVNLWNSSIGNSKGIFSIFFGKFQELFKFKLGLYNFAIFLINYVSKMFLKWII